MLLKLLLLLLTTTVTNFTVNTTGCIAWQGKHWSNCKTATFLLGRCGSLAAMFLCACCLSVVKLWFLCLAGVAPCSIH